MALRVLGRAWLVVTVALAGAGAASHFDLMTADRLGPLANTAEVAAPDGDSFAPSTSEFDSFPGVGYGGIDLALLEARSIPENNSGRPIVALELAARNNSAVQVRVPVSMVRLIGPERVMVQADRFDYAEHGDRLVVGPGEVRRALAVFKLRSASSTDLADYQLQIGEPGRWPVNLPLEGPAPEPAFPKPLQAVSSQDPIRYEDLRLELVEASTALEYGVYRASVGRHLAVITVRLSGPPPGSPALIERPLWTLIDGDSQRQAIRAIAGRPSIADGTVTMELVFSYSTKSSELALLVGEPDDRIPVADFEVQAAE